MRQCDVLIYVEDPGAANFVARLPEFLQQEQIACRLCAGGEARAYLTDRGVAYDDIAQQTDAEALLREYDPRLLIAGTAENPDTLALHLIDAARREAIPSVGVVDAFVNAKHRFRGRGVAPLHYAPDWILVPDEPTFEAFCNLGHPADRVRLVGHPHYDQVRQLGEELRREGKNTIRRRFYPSLENERKIVVFLAEVSRGFDPAQFRRSKQYTLLGSGRYDKRTEIVLEEFLSAADALPDDPFLVLRLHPKNTREEFGELADSFDEISAGGCPLERMFAADVVVGMTTSLLTEAALMGTPAMSVLPREQERDWLPAAARQYLPVVTTREALHDELGRLLCKGPSSVSDNSGQSTATALELMTQLIREQLQSTRQAESEPSCIPK